MKKLSFARIFGDNMILQREKPFYVWGFCQGGKVKVSLNGKTSFFKTCFPDEKGEFVAMFDKMPGGNNSYTIMAECDDEKIEISNVRFGDVFLLLGQSNISYTLSSVEKAEEYINESKNCDISAISLREEFDENNQVKRSCLPLDDLLYEYSYSTGRVGNIGDYSAIGVMTAILINKKTGIPTGFVDTSMGGLSIESYLPYGCVERDKTLKKSLKKYDRYVDKEHYNKQGARNFAQLYGVYNEKIAPISRLKFCCAIWYLGESSAYDFGLSVCFEKELEIIIKNYRKIFGNIPFININIAPEYYFYGDGYGYHYINEAINRVGKGNENCFSIPLYNIEPRWLKENGETFYHPIHPVNKEPVARKIAEIYVNNFIEYNYTAYPFLKNACNNGENGYIIEIGNHGKGIKKNSNINGFALKNSDGRYYRADAKVISNNKILLSSCGVKNPVGVSYGFMQYQNECNCFLKDGKELLTFCSERTQITPSFFPCPQFMNFSNLYVYENCFGCSTGTSKKYRSWESGEIYGCISNIKHIKNRETGGYSLKFKCNPTNKGYYFFSISPKICLSGESSGLSCYPYIKLQMRVDKDIEFYGIVARMANGNVYRFAPLKMGEMTDFIVINGGSSSAIYFSLENCFGEDMSKIKLREKERENIVQIEFMARSKDSCTVIFDDIRYVPQKENINYQTKIEVENRADTVLPDSNN